MNVHEWTRITLDWIRLEDITVDGSPVALADLTAALIPVGTRPTGETAWLDPEPHPDDGVPALLVAGPDADSASPAVVLTANAELHGRVVKDGTVVTAKLARVNLI